MLSFQKKGDGKGSKTVDELLDIDLRSASRQQFIVSGVKR